MAHARSIKISIVVPVFDDYPALEALLATIERFDDAPAEVIVVDGGDDAGVRELVTRAGCRYLTTRAGRGHQLHRGAGQATGNVLWFLHADAEPSTRSLEAIRRAVRAGAVGGYFRFRFTGQPAWYKSMLAALINLRSRVGIPYGDQGLFIRKAAYDDADGFPDAALFEEVPLIRAVRAAGHFVRLRLPIGVSPRRWERDGWIRRTIGNRLLAAGFLLGLSPETLARYYRAMLPREQAEC